MHESHTRINLNEINVAVLPLALGHAMVLFANLFELKDLKKNSI
jgi:hypothetical protein